VTKLIHNLYKCVLVEEYGMVKELDFKSTAELKVPEQIIEQVIGQDEACKIARKAARQRRHVLLIGEPGTGK
jgi:Lon-like ATP-dependent protease